MDTKPMGNIWKEGRWWKVKLPHGIETLPTKKLAQKWAHAFANDITLWEVLNKQEA